MDELPDVNITDEIKEQALVGKVMNILDDITKPTKTQAAWTIFYRGKQIVLISTGKSVWKARNHASAALNSKVWNAFEHHLRLTKGSDYSYSNEAKKKFRDILQKLQDDGILEYRQLIKEDGDTNE